jgi:hypothetical protein
VVSPIQLNPHPRDGTFLRPIVHLAFYACIEDGRNAPIQCTIAACRITIDAEFLRSSSWGVLHCTSQVRERFLRSAEKVIGESLILQYIRVNRSILV